MNPFFAIGRVQEELLREMEDLIRQKEIHQEELVKIETRMTQVMGGLQTVTAISHAVSDDIKKADLDRQTSEIQVTPLRSDSTEKFQARPSLSHPSSQGSDQNKGRRKRKKG